MERWVKLIYVSWNKRQKAKFVNRDNRDYKITRWGDLFEWDRNVGRIQRMINKAEKQKIKRNG